MQESGDRPARRNMISYVVREFNYNRLEVSLLPIQNLIHHPTWDAWGDWGYLKCIGVFLFKEISGT